MRRARVCVTLAAVAFGAACAPAIRELPPFSTLGEKSGAPTRKASPGEVDSLLDEAGRLFAMRPDMSAVTQAYGTYISAARADDTRIEGLLGAARSAAWLIEHEPDDSRRSLLATEAVQACQWCRERTAARDAGDPDAIECKYRLALALGQQARERRSTARDGLERMTALLEEVIEQAPLLDRAGGHRVLALMLLRAPGWPAGPGDPETALEHATQADALVPNDADNLMVLAEALAENGEPVRARTTYERAAALARARAARGDPDAPDIVEAASLALKRLSRRD